MLILQFSLLVPKIVNWHIVYQPIFRDIVMRANQVLNLYELTKYKAFVAKCDPSILFDFAPNVDLSGCPELNTAKNCDILCSNFGLCIFKPERFRARINKLSLVNISHDFSISRDQFITHGCHNYTIWYSNQS